MSYGLFKKTKDDENQEIDKISLRWFASTFCVTMARQQKQPTNQCSEMNKRLCHSTIPSQTMAICFYIHPDRRSNQTSVHSFGLSQVFYSLSDGDLFLFCESIFSFTFSSGCFFLSLCLLFSPCFFYVLLISIFHAFSSFCFNIFFFISIVLISVFFGAVLWFFRLDIYDDYNMIE